MRTPEEKRRLALAAPLMHLVIGSLLLGLAARPESLMVPMLIAAVVVPTAIGIWVFAGRPPLSRILLATWAPAGEVLLLVLLVLAMRPSGVSAGLFMGMVVGPLLVLLALGLFALRAQKRSVWLIAMVLWVLVLAEVAVAVPLSERFGSTEDMQAITGIVILLLAPAAALGAWGGLSLAALVPEPMPPQATAEAAVEVAGGEPL
ncbi:MAG: hypothetical protein Q7W51_09675 [Coriobacteriia bacterium]|nr:hypothetical protein [Coriobacteriia bacterium]